MRCTQDLETAKAICDVSEVIINTAKMQVQFLKELGPNKHTGFIQLEEKNN